jgi:uncharacterized protein (TIGR03643 family)
MTFNNNFNRDDITDIVNEAWEIGWFKSNVSFKSILKKWSLTEEDLYIIMFQELDTKSFKYWKKKINSRKN